MCKKAVLYGKQPFSQRPHKLRLQSGAGKTRLHLVQQRLTLKGTLNRDRQALLDKVQTGLTGVGLKPEFMRAL